METERITQLENWINEVEDTLDRGLAPQDDDGSDMTIHSARECIAMWQEEIVSLGGQIDFGPEPVEGEPESDFPTLFAA